MKARRDGMGLMERLDLAAETGRQNPLALWGFGYTAALGGAAGYPPGWDLLALGFAAYLALLQTVLERAKRRGDGV